MERLDRSPLPAPLAALEPLAANLRWSWHAPTRAVFERLDADLWARTRGDAWRLLQEVPAGRLEAAAVDATYVASVEAAAADLRAYLAAPNTWYHDRYGAHPLRIAYLSAEFGVIAGLRIYSGGLGVLAGDHLKSASDLGVPLTAIGIYYREGYFTQHIDGGGQQQDVYEPVDPRLLPLREVGGASGPLRITIPVAGHDVVARVWRAAVGRVPLYLLDTNLEQNRPEDRRITDRLYGGDDKHRIRQELVLGIGAVRLLDAIGESHAVLHLNEGHAAFAALERACQVLTQVPPTVSRSHTAFADALAKTSRSIVFTTHTPVEAGHDYFTPALVEEALGPYLWSVGIPLVDVLAAGRRDAKDERERFCMTILAMRGSSRRNGVSQLHGKVSREMWAELWPELAEKDVPIGAITNGVHLPTWVAAPTAALYERYVGEKWAETFDPFHWRGIDDIPDEPLWQARTAQRRRLIEVVRGRLLASRGRTRPFAGESLDENALTLVFARRFATYKRATLLLSQTDRLLRLLNGERPVQVVFAGKAHPRDEFGKALLREIALFAERAENAGRFVFLEDYDVELAHALVQGADIWLNVPVRPREASGTSGMKAAANGALNVSIADGWWAEAWLEHNRQHDPVGWTVHTDETHANDSERDRADAETLFGVLETEVVPLFAERTDNGLPSAWLRRVRSCLRQLPPFFNTHRMVQQYVDEAYMAAAASVPTSAVAGGLGS